MFLAALKTDDEQRRVDEIITEGRRSIRDRNTRQTRSSWNQREEEEEEEDV